MFCFGVFLTMFVRFGMVPVVGPGFYLSCVV